jgi:nicotinamidase-related amidase
LHRIQSLANSIPDPADSPILQAAKIILQEAPLRETTLVRGPQSTTNRKEKAMPLTKLDPVGLPTAQPAAEIVERSARLARAFRERGLTVVLVNVTGRAPGRTSFTRPMPPFPPDWTELVPELEQQPGDILISKLRVGAFIGTSLDGDLRRRGVTQVFLAGVATSAGVEATARSAYDQGYNVVLVVDAMTDLDPEAHSYSVEKTFPRLGETDTTENVLKLLSESAAQ